MLRYVGRGVWVGLGRWGRSLGGVGVRGTGKLTMGTEYILVRHPTLAPGVTLTTVSPLTIKADVIRGH